MRNEELHVRKQMRLKYQDVPLNCKIRKMCNSTKEEYVNREGSEIQNNYLANPLEAHQKISKIAGRKKSSRNLKGLRNDDGLICRAGGYFSKMGEVHWSAVQ